MGIDLGIGEGGTYPVLPTIFRPGGEIDEAGVRSVAEFVIATGADGIVFPGLASEYDMLSLDERASLVEVIGDVARGRVNFIVGASGSSLAESQKMIEAGASAGAAAAMVMTPGRLAGDLPGLIDFYRTLGEAAGLEIMLQNAPKPMGSGLTSAEVLAVVDAVPQVAYVKEENMPCGQRISALLANRPGSLRGVFGGAGGRYITDELARGAVGTMPASELPEISVALMRAHRAGDVGRVRDLHERMLPVLMMQAIFRWDLTKEVLRRRGLIDSAYVRAAGPRLDDGDQRELGVLLSRLSDLLPGAFATEVAA